MKAFFSKWCARGVSTTAMARWTRERSCCIIHVGSFCEALGHGHKFISLVLIVKLLLQKKCWSLVLLSHPYTRCAYSIHSYIGVYGAPYTPVVSSLSAHTLLAVPLISRASVVQNTWHQNCTHSRYVRTIKGYKLDGTKDYDYRTNFTCTMTFPIIPPVS